MTDAVPLLKATQANCTCPVCLDVFKDPVAFHCGHVLCRACAVRCITARPRCPLCNQSVPNTRHILPLPQLSLFCVCAREVGLRAREQKQQQQQQAVAEVAHPSLSTSISDDVDVKRPRTESSPPLCWDTAAAHLPQLLLHNTVSDTQRLHSESPERAASVTPPPHEGTEQTNNGSTVLCSPFVGREGRASDDCNNTSTPSSAEGATTTSPLTPTLALLQARFAEDTEQLESTPRLNSANSAVAAAQWARDTHPRREGHFHDSVVLPQSHSAAEAAAWWRPWRRGHGVVHCALTPPALRLDASLCDVQGQHASTHGTRIYDTTNLAEVAQGTARGVRQMGRDGATADALPTAAASVMPPTEVNRVYRAGTCVLCGLDVVQRTAVRHRLQRLLRSPFAQCDTAELMTQTEDGLALLLGPLWGVTCECVADAPASSASSLTGDGAYTTTDSGDFVGDGVGPRRTSHPSRTSLRAVAHHNCLAWSGLLDVYTDTSPSPSPLDGDGGAASAAAAATTTRTLLRMSVPMVDPFSLYASHASGRVARWQLLAATLWRLHHLPEDPEGDSQEKKEEEEVEGIREHAPAAEQQRRRAEEGSRASSVAATPRCALCDAPLSLSPSSPTVEASSAVLDVFGVGLRTCEGVERGESSCGRHFHYPCALLAGASACLVFGLEDEQNVLRVADGACVRMPQEDTRRAGHPVEVWCGPCRERHEARRRSKPT